MALFKWDGLVFTHISARVPGTEDQFLINPYGLMFDEITASSLVKVDLHGNQLSKSDYSINPAGFTIHSAIHEVREDATGLFVKGRILTEVEKGREAAALLAAVTRL